jgi:uncharacterized protein
VNYVEQPVVFECAGSELVGMIHVPTNPQRRGMISIVAGGPQYRAGVGRMQVQMARELAANGVATFRFDYRGLGDSEGEFRGFEDIEDDLAAAISAFREHAPCVQEIVLWGGCDAASAILINAWRHPEVVGLVLGNPWVHSGTTADAVAVKHYGQRLRNLDFWMKVLRLQYNPIPAMATMRRRFFVSFGRRQSEFSSDTDPFSENVKSNFVVRMRDGLRRFNGDVLLLMSGRSLLSKEFDELISNDPLWRSAVRGPRRLSRCDIPDGDQTFSSSATRGEVSNITLRWLQDPNCVLPDAQLSA